MALIRLGTSGWSYKDWEGVFYPRDEKTKLAFYSKVFKTTEIDSTFYEYPKKAMIQACARITPDDFVFSAVVPKLVTHDKKLSVQKGAGDDLMQFLHELRPIEAVGKLGPVIFRLPPTFTYEKGLGPMIDFLGALPADVKFAVQFESRSWHRPETWDLLKQCKIAYVMVDGHAPSTELVATADFAVVSWQGRGKNPQGDYRYTDAQVNEWVLAVEEVAGRVKEVYGYFANHFRGNSVDNALRMIGKLGLADDFQKELGSRVTRAIQLKGMRYTKPQKTFEEPPEEES